MCDEFNFLVGLLFFTKVPKNQAVAQIISLYPLIDLYLKYVASFNAMKNPLWPEPYFYLNAAAYEAQFNINQNISKANAFDFCGFDCTILSIHASDLNSQAVSEYFYQLGDGSCASVVVTSNW